LQVRKMVFPICKNKTQIIRCFLVLVHLEWRYKAYIGGLPPCKASL
jgi:hypothetical protein